MMMKFVVAASVFLTAAAGPLSAASFKEESEFLGSIWASSQICGVDLDKEKGLSFIHSLAEETSLKLNSGTVYLASRRVVRENENWSEDELAHFCKWTEEAAGNLDLLRD